MLPDFDRDVRFTRAEIVGFTVILVLATMLPLVDCAVLWYWAGMCLAGAFLLYHVGKLAASSSSVRASRVLHASVLYLPVVLGIMVAWKA
jgi:heme O synthase-like polyprenyltransferase